ncbi:MAG: ribonuclease HII [Candidatus Methanodesulfokora sp.]
MRYLGIDEAGRGPVIGPMVICGVLADDESLKKLVEMGVRDSKLLRPERREELSIKIRDVVIDYIILEVSPKEIDLAVLGRGLNRLEARKMAYIISKFDFDIAIVDAPGRRPEKFGQMIRKLTGKEIIAENFADRKYPVVSAASILAKVRRDEIIRGYEEVYGEIGSGYASDRRTVMFLRRYMEKHGDLPDIVRRSWRTSREILSDLTKFMK